MILSSDNDIQIRCIRQFKSVGFGALLLSETETAMLICDHACSITQVKDSGKCGR